MNSKHLIEYFGTLFNVRGEKRGSIQALFTVEGVAYLLCFFLTSGVPNEKELGLILTQQSECSIPLYYSLIFAIVLIRAVATNPCHPVVGLAVGLSRYLCQFGLENVLHRRLFPWEAALVDATCYAIWCLVFGRKTGPRKVMSRAVSTFLRGVILCLGAFIVDQLVDSSKLGTYLYRAFRAARQYAKDAAVFLNATAPIAETVSQILQE